VRVLVLGSNGMAGHVIADVLKKEHNVITLARNNADINMEITSSNLNQITLKGFDAIINAMGILVNESQQNKEIANLINTKLPKYLEANSGNAKVIHLSTDCVFSGKDGNYNELSDTDGTSDYALTKIAGEIDNDKDLTIRTSIIGPELKDGTGLFHWLAKNKNNTVIGFDNHIWNGITTLELAWFLSDVLFYIENIPKTNGLTGIVHLFSDTISKYDLLCLINNIFEFNVNINKYNDINDINKTLTTGGARMIKKSLNKQLASLFDYIYQNRAKYPMYNIERLPSTLVPKKE
jgi:dTDP-4-dehydrorhamnose reductase